MRRFEEAGLPIQERPERPPLEILADLKELGRKDDQKRRDPSGFSKNWFAGVRGCLEIALSEGSIPQQAVQETQKFLEESLSVEFRQRISSSAAGEEVAKTYELIDKVLERKPAGN